MFNELVDVESPNVLIKAFENNENGWTIRAIEIDNEVWFVGKDIAEALGYKNTRDALSRHVPDKYKKVLTAQQMASVSKSRDSQPLVDSPRGLTFINEAGLYKLVMRSELPNAEKLSDWVCDTVLPSIRKTGSYSVQPKEITSEFLFQIAEQLKIKEQQYLLEKARADENQEVKDLYDATNASEEYWLPMKTVADVLDVIGIGRNNLYKFLREQHVLSQNNEPMRCYQEMGYIRSSYVTGFKNQVICVVSLKGLKFIFKKLQNAGLIPRTTQMEEWLKLCTALNNGEDVINANQEALI